MFAIGGTCFFCLRRNSSITIIGIRLICIYPWSYYYPTRQHQTPRNQFKLRRARIFISKLRHKTESRTAVQPQTFGELLNILFDEINSIFRNTFSARLFERNKILRIILFGLLIEWLLRFEIGFVAAIITVVVRHLFYVATKQLFSFVLVDNCIKATLNYIVRETLV